MAVWGSIDRRTVLRAGASLATLALAGGCGREPIGATIVYEFAESVDLAAVEKTLVARGTKIPIDDPTARRARVDQLLTGLVDWRINVDIKLADVKKRDDGAFVVGVYGDRPDRVALVERRLTRRGSLEFQPLAARGVNDELIAAAESSSVAEVSGPDGRVARWVPLARKSDGSPRARLDDARVVRRTRDGRDEALLAIEPKLNVRETNLKKIFASNDAAGGLALAYWLDAPSGIALAEVGARLRGESPGPRRMGVLIEGELFDAPTIDGPLGDHGVVSGIESPADARDWVAIFTHGPFPSAMRKREDSSPNG